jgi:hypothetical protein
MGERTATLYSVVQNWPMFREMKWNSDENRKRAIREYREGMIKDGSEVWGLERNKLVEYLRCLSGEALTRAAVLNELLDHTTCGLERAAGFEPATTCLGSKDSTTELRPLAGDLIQEHRLAV